MWLPSPDEERKLPQEGTEKDIVGPGQADARYDNLAIELADVEAATTWEDRETGVKVVERDLAHALVPLLHDARVAERHRSHFESVVKLLEHLRTLVLVDIWFKQTNIP